MCRKKLYIFACLLFVTLNSCVKSDPEEDASERVLLVYVGTDNNLVGYEQAKLDALRKGWGGSSKDHIIVYRDTRNVDARLIEISNLAPEESPRVIASYGRENSASAEVFARVIHDVKAMYPRAESFGLLIFSHASGWLPQGALTNPYQESYPAPEQTKSLVIDGVNEMTLPDFAAAIPDGTFHYIAFEMCFTSGIEVAYELRNKTDYIFASSAEIVHPGFAPVYGSATTRLISGDITGFAQSVFDHVLTYPENSLQRSVTYSVIRTRQLQSLAQFVRTNCDQHREVEVNTMQHFDRYSYRLFFDFGDYFSQLLDNDEQRTELQRLIDECVVWKANTTEFMTQEPGNKGFRITKHSGLTSYIPQPQFAGLNNAYRELLWIKAIQEK